MLLVVGATGAAAVWLLLTLVGVVGSAPAARAISGALLVVGVLVVVAAGLWLRRLASPAGRIVEAARRIEGGDYTARVPVRGPTELRSVARAFNAMTARLEAGEAHRRSVLAEVTHELRTPLSVIRAQAEGIADGVYPVDAQHVRPILEATRSIEVLVDDLRTLSLVDEGGLRLEREPVDVAVLVHGALANAREAAVAAGVALAADVEPAGLTLDADPVRLRSALGNLLENAIRHCRAGGGVTVVARRTGDDVAIAVRDDGEGIPEGLRQRVFDRFVKGPGSPGSGLGLAIVRDIAEAHGGSVSLSSAVGGGTTVEMRLPKGAE